MPTQICSDCDYYWRTDPEFDSAPYCNHPKSTGKWLEDEGYSDEDEAPEWCPLSIPPIDGESEEG
jgi:hypothetical protein